jgi:RNA polymerase sigma-70 factor (ECF subfamily)
MTKPSEESRESVGSTSTSLLARVRDFDQEAWERFVDLYGPLIYYWCRRAGLKPQDAADLVQEVFGSVIVGIRRFRKERPEDTLRGWLWTITRNRLRDRARVQARRPEAAGGTDAQQRLLQIPEQPPEEMTASSGSSLIGGFTRRALDCVREEFRERTWKAFCMATFENRSSQDIGKELGMTANAVRQAKIRVLRRLRRELGDLLD